MQCGDMEPSAAPTSALTAPSCPISTDCCVQCFGEYRQVRQLLVRVMLTHTCSMLHDMRMLIYFELSKVLADQDKVPTALDLLNKVSYLLL